MRGRAPFLGGPPTTPGHLSRRGRDTQPAGGASVHCPLTRGAVGSRRENRYGQPRTASGRWRDRRVHGEDVPYAGGAGARGSRPHPRHQPVDHRDRRRCPHAPGSHGAHPSACPGPLAGGEPGAPQPRPPRHRPGVRMGRGGLVVLAPSRRIAGDPLGDAALRRRGPRAVDPATALAHLRPAVAGAFPDAAERAGDLAIDESRRRGRQAVAAPAGVDHHRSHRDSPSSRRRGQPSRGSPRHGVRPHVRPSGAAQGRGHVDRRPARGAGEPTQLARRLRRRGHGAGRTQLPRHRPRTLRGVLARLHFLPELPQARLFPIVAPPGWW